MAKKYIPKFTSGSTIASDQMARTYIAPLASRRQKNNMLKAQAELSGENFESISREQYKKDKQENLLQRKAVGQPIGIHSEHGQNITSGITQGIGMGTDLASQFIDVEENSSFKQQQMVGDALLKSGNPYAMIAGAAVKTLSATDQALGINMNTISKKEASASGVKGWERALNNVIGFAPGTGIGALLGNTGSVKMSEQTRAMGDSFSGAVDSIGIAEGMSDGKYLFGRNRINALIKEADRQNRLITDLSLTNTQRKLSDYSTDLATQNINRYAGHNYQNIHVGKKGLKLLPPNEIRKLFLQNPQYLKGGGVIGVDTNIIADGKYHAHKNNLSDISEEFENLTKKGIPIVLEDTSGELKQIAEIERKELILRLEVTKKLEELMKEDSEEAMIEAGKLLSVEIMENSQDNTGEVLHE